MADNLGYTQGSGSSVATDEVGGVHYQKVKVDVGADGVSAPWDGSVLVGNFPATQAVTGTFWQATQPVSAASLPLPTGAATEATIATLASVVKAEDSAGADGDNGFVVLAQRRDSDSPSAGTDGDYTTLKMDESGRLKVAVQPASYPITTGNIAAINGQVALNVSRVSNIMIQMRANPTVSNQNVTFEASLNSTNGTDGNWITIQAVRSNANTIETATGNLSATPAYGWECSVNGMNWFRVRATAHASGTAEWIIQPAPYATEPIPAAQISGTQPVSGTVTANLGAATTRAGFFAAHGFWYDDSSTALAANATFTGTSRDLFATATGVAWATATIQGKEFRVSAESDVSGTLWIEASRDNTNWRRVKSVATAAVTGGGHYAEIVHRPSWRYIRVGFTNGATIQARFTINSASVGA